MKKMRMPANLVVDVSGTLHMEAMNAVQVEINDKII